jgi:uncharacterized protein (TIGR03437 family)
MRRRHPFSSFWLLFVEFLDGFAKSFASSASKLMALETKFIAMFTLNRRTYANCYGLKQSWNLVLAPELLFSRTVRIKKQTLRRSKTTARKHDFYSILALVSLLGLGITQSARANLITNGGFETGDFSGWTVFGIDNDVVGANPFTSPHSGNFQALFGSGSNFITQNVTTTPGSSYVISFWLAASVPQGGSPFVSVNWSGSTIFSDSLTSPFGYTEYTFAVNALSPATPLQFQFFSIFGNLFFLDDISVTVNNKPAAVYYISPTQINVQAPADDAVGQVVVTVNTARGASWTSAALNRFAPGFFKFDPAGRKYIAARHPDGAAVGPAGIFGGDPSRPAAPGQIISLYGTGFGATNPALPPAQVVTVPAVLAEPVTVRFGSAPAEVQWAGISGAGLYQFNVVVPDVPNGDVEVVAEIGGVRTGPGDFIFVQRP